MIILQPIFVEPDPSWPADDGRADRSPGRGRARRGGASGAPAGQLRRTDERGVQPRWPAAVVVQRHAGAGRRGRPPDDGRRGRADGRCLRARRPRGHGSRPRRRRAARRARLPHPPVVQPVGQRSGRRVGRPAGVQPGGDRDGSGRRSARTRSSASGWPSTTSVLPSRAACRSSACAQIGSAVVETGSIDYLNTSIGSKAPDYAAIAVASYRTRPGHELELTHAMRAAIGAAVPVVGVGRILTAEQGEQALANGDCDLVAMTRGHIADPDIAVKVRRGDSHRVRRCVGANECNDRKLAGFNIACFHNPDVGREARGPVTPTRRAAAGARRRRRARRPEGGGARRPPWARRRDPRPRAGSRRGVAPRQSDRRTGAVPRRGPPGRRAGAARCATTPVDRSRSRR